MRAVVAALAVLAIAPAARAHVDPPGCTPAPVAIDMRVFRGDGVTNVIGGVSECESVFYQVSVHKSSAGSCAFEGGAFTMTLPNGTSVVVSPSVPCVGGTLSPCDPSTVNVTSGLIPYTVSLADVVGGLITATATYSGGVLHDGEVDTPLGSFPMQKKTSVLLCADGKKCTQDLCDPAKAGSAACSNPDVVCDDGDKCTTEVCDPQTGACTQTGATTCDDNNACTTEACNPSTGKCETLDTKTCDDQNACTDDSCDSATGACVFTDVVTPTCGDDDLCTRDVCDPATGQCEYPPIDLVCDDNNACTTEACNPLTGTCKTTSELDCNDNDACTDDGCAAASGCTHTPIVCNDDDACTDDTCSPTDGCKFVDNSARCDDEDACTIDACDALLGCTHTPSTTLGCLPLNHFQCYETKPFAFTKIPGVTIQDRYGTTTLPIRTPHPFCLPSDKNGEDPTAATDPDHLFGYADANGPVGIGAQTVTNQFGTVTLDLVRRTYLMVPTAKSLSGPTPPLAAPVTDHFQCYSVKRTRGTAKFVPQRGVSAVDQFGAHTLDVLRPRYLCVPANKNGEDPTAPSHPDSLVCYKARHRDPFGTMHPFTNNQFGPLEITLTRRLEFCVPSKVVTD